MSSFLYHKDSHRSQYRGNLCPKWKVWLLADIIPCHSAIAYKIEVMIGTSNSSLDRSGADQLGHPPCKPGLVAKSSALLGR